jgi:C-terminal processing protease CtpA/Prc
MRLLVVSASLALSCAPARGTMGAMLGQLTDGRVFIRDAPDKLAASESGLLPGDEILLVNGIDVRTLDAKGLHAALSGDVGTPLKLTVVRGEAVIRVTVRRTPAGRPRRRAEAP